MRVAVLASGAGTNLQALLDRRRRARWVSVVAVGSDQPAAPALERARRRVWRSKFPERSAFDDRARGTPRWRMAARTGAELVVLAGYMQLLSRRFLARFPGAVINVHPALLPAFPGLGAVEQALAYGVKVFGVTVHFVDEGVDRGR